MCIQKIPKLFEINTKSDLKEVKYLILGLNNLKGIGNKTVKAILDNCHFDARRFLDLSDHDIRQILLKARVPNYKDISSIIYIIITGKLVII